MDGLIKGFLIFWLLWALSFGLWKLLDSVIYRIRKQNDQFSLVGLSFVVVTAVVAGLLVLLQPGLLSGNHSLSEWPLMTFAFCSAAAGLVLVGLAIHLIDVLQRRAFEAIRGD